jgi:hypothetical protein
MLMTTHNTMQQQDTMKMLKMKWNAKNQEFKFVNEQGAKILKKNKHKV